MNLFHVQLGISAFALALSTGMLVSGHDAAVYLPVITSIIGYWLPAPKPRVVEKVADQSSVNQQQPQRERANSSSQRRAADGVHSDDVVEEISLAPVLPQASVSSAPVDSS